jgi:hypothetical protein
MTTRFPNGLTTATKNAPFGDFILPDATQCHTYFNDFDTYDATEWTVTETGSATQALTDGDGGLLLITNAAADNDASFSQKVGESFLFEEKKPLWFDCRFKVSDATQSDVVMGLSITDTTPLSVSDGVYFLKADDAASIVMKVVKNGTATTTTVGTLVSDTFIRLSYFYDGISKITAFLDGVQIANSVVTNLPDDEVLTITYGIQNGSAVSRNMTIDYIFAAKQR